MIALLVSTSLLCAPLILAGLRRTALPAGRGAPSPCPAAASGPRSTFDLGRACSEAAHALAHDAARRRASLRLAIAGPLSVSGDEAAIAAALRRTIAAAVAGAGGAVLVSAGPHGGRARVAVLWDSPAADSLEADLRDVAQTVALHGGSLDVERHAGGASVVIRLPPAPPERAPSDALARIEERVPALP